MKKRVIIKIVSLLMMIFVFGTTAFAAVPEIAYQKDAESNASEEELYFYVTKPDEAEVTVFDNCYYVSAYGEDGVEVYFLIFDNEADCYFDLDVEQEEAEEVTEEISPCVVGASGLLLQEVNLPYNGLNKMRIVAVKGELYTIMDRDIMVLDESIKEEIAKDTWLRFGDIIRNIFDSITR